MKLFMMAALAVANSLNVHDFPKTAFSCRDKNAGEYYADLELGCQVYHICALGQFNRLTKMSFACPNGTLFSQSSRICNSEDKVYCPLAERYYDNVQGTIDTQDDYRSVFKVDTQPVFPLEPTRRRRPAISVSDDDYDDEGTTASPRRSSNRRQPLRPTTTTTTTPAPRPRPPQRQFTPQIPQPVQFEPQPPQDFRPPAGAFLPPRTNSRPSSPVVRPQLVVTQTPVEYATPQRSAIPQFGPAPPAPPPPSPAGLIPRVPGTLPSTQRPENLQTPNRLTLNRPSIRRPSPFGGAQTTTPTPTTTTTTVDPNAEYEYYDYEENTDGQNNSQQ
ncbi:pollen-specific leucine-rich repeat extensin-like protein 2 [Varroa jacobsoni]|uniref:Chitin-binding type-2 domain-containing protein n=1 Tax=Varroa destructor TaxID=109461 RepID=A0A7M7KIL5_VARDE|nr:pollen-specific leucine-rich repeat extensin-like protein 2 [Varroa destructor]XP_022710491.1 pollen-specific leucine-rich repeat extensin-like protein 2 [Varroa jacobsoni]